MLLDRSLRATIRNFSTLFLVVFIALAPLHLVYGFAFHRVLELRELHPAITDFPPTRLVRGVGRDALARANVWFWALAAIEVAAIPFFLRASRHVLATDARGEVSTAIGAWRSLPHPAHFDAGSGSRVFTGVVGAAVGIVIGSLVEMIGMALVNLLPDSLAFAAISLTQATARSAGAAFFLVAMVHALSARDEAPAQVPDLF